MKITKKILKHRAKQALDTAKYLDISGLGIGAIEGLDNCRQLEVLDLSHNNIEEVEGIKCCEHLWNINLSHNEISSLFEVSQFYAFGTLDLSYNNISWQELSRIQSVIILDLQLIGNLELEKDAHYRIHVIDCLPNIWMLDGRIITSAERNQAQNFFQDSALSSRPVRKKLGERASATRQRINAGSIHGDRTSVLVSRFARNEIHSAGTDQRRLLFLFENMHFDLAAIPKSFTNYSPFQEDYFKKIMIAREEEREHGNVLLLLLLASLEFSLPKELLDETLQITKLGSYASIDIALLFTLDRQWKIRLASLLLSACKLDRDMCVEGSGGLYDRLYLCLYYLVTELIRSDWKNWKRRSSGNFDKAKEHKMYLSSYLRPQTAPNMKENYYVKRIMDQSKEEHRMLLASEILLLLSVVPSFYKYIENDPAMRSLLQASTNDATLTSKLVEIAKEAREQGGDMQDLYKEISHHSVQQIEQATLGIRFAAISHYLFPAVQNKFSPTNETRSEWKIILNTKKAYSKRPKSAVLTSGEHLTSGKRRSYSNMQRNFSRKTTRLQHNSNEPKLTLGSNILLGPQNMARVIAIPETNIALVQMSSVPAPNGSIIIQTQNEEDHYSYVDIKRLEYDSHLNCWKPTGSVGDKVTLQAAVRTQKIDASTPRTLDVLISDREYRKSSQGFRARHSSIVSSKTSVTHRSLPAQKDHSVYHTVDGVVDIEKDLDSAITDASLPPRPLSALFNEKMNLRLPAQSHDIWTEIDSHNYLSGSIDLALTSQSIPLDKSCLIAGDLIDTEENLTSENHDPMDQYSKSIPNIEISGPDRGIDVENLQLPDSGEIDVEPIPPQDIDNKVFEIPHRDSRGLENVDDEPDPELQALVDEEPAVESSKNVGARRNIASGHGRRAISARRPKHAKVTDSFNRRPVSAVIRSRDVKGRASKLYGDEINLDRPDSASSFQLERTEAWRSSASSSMNLTFDENPLKSTMFGVLPAHGSSKKGSIHVIALRPTPPQRPSSPQHATSNKRDSFDGKTSRQQTPVNLDHARDKGMKLASNWLADGKDLHEEYKNSRVYMSPHVPGYLSGINNQSSSNKIASSSLPLTASLTSKPDGFSSMRSSRRATPTSNQRDYVPPGIGMPMPDLKTRFSPVGDVRQLSAKYPTVALVRPFYKK